MKWEAITNERSSLQEYRLIENNDCKVVLKYNPLHQSARITSGTHHRLFFFESAGSLSGKTIFRNEYGMETGSLIHDKFHPSEGALVIDAKKYQYRLQNNVLPELIIYENGFQNPISSCSMPSGKIINPDVFSSGSSATDNNCYLLGLCWYLFLPSYSKEYIPQYATAGF